VTKQGIEYLEGVYANCVRRGRQYGEKRKEGNLGAAMAEIGYNQQRDLIEAIAQFERFPLPDHDAIFGKEATQ